MTLAQWRVLKTLEINPDAKINIGALKSTRVIEFGLKLSTEENSVNDLISKGYLKRNRNSRKYHLTLKGFKLLDRDVDPNELINDCIIEIPKEVFNTINSSRLSCIDKINAADMYSVIWEHCKSNPTGFTKIVGDQFGRLPRKETRKLLSDLGVLETYIPLEERGRAITYRPIIESDETILFDLMSFKEETSTSSYDDLFNSSQPKLSPVNRVVIDWATSVFKECGIKYNIGAEYIGWSKEYTKYGYHFTTRTLATQEIFSKPVRQLDQSVDNFVSFVQNQFNK